MVGVRKTPGVYINEIPAATGVVTEVATAIAAFIGHTEKAERQGQSLIGKPYSLSSMVEFQAWYGGPPPPRFTLDEAADAASADLIVEAKAYSLQPVVTAYGLALAMQQFFANGGGACVIVSVGDYQTPPSADAIQQGLDALKLEIGPTLVLAPDAVLLTDAAACSTVHQAMLQHCVDTESRIAILDLHRGALGRGDPGGDPVAQFRDGVGETGLDRGVAYYPWLDTTTVDDRDLTYQAIVGGGVSLDTLVRAGLQAGLAPGASLSADLTALVAFLSALPAGMTPAQLDLDLRANSPVYVEVMAAMARRLNRLPPGPAMAGAYAANDANRGVWTAPANLGLHGVIAPTVAINDSDQTDLNTPVFGKAVNAIRTFPGQGVLVWGARTLDANSPDWRYINARRTAIMIEQSCRSACQAYVFAANTAQTWTTLTTELEAYLQGLWSRGGLMGASAADAFTVACGLGTTMTDDDVLNGYLRVSIKLALTHPAEFIEMTFQQQMPTT